MATVTPRLGLSKPASTDLVSAFQTTVGPSFDGIDSTMLIYKGPWNSGHAYAANDVVLYQGVFFIAKGASLGETPPGTDWAGTLAATVLPGVFRVDDYGAQGDVVGGTDGVVTGTAFTSASGSFGASVIGKTIVISRAGSSGAGFVTTVAGLVSSTALTLTNAVTTNVASGAVYCIGTDDTTNVQAAITAAGAAGGGTVQFSLKRYLFTGHLTVPAGVTLVGVTRGPYRPYQHPEAVTLASTLLPTDTSGAAFIQFGANSTNGGAAGGGVEDLLIHYPNQVTYAASTPSSAFGPTIINVAGNAGGLNLRRFTITNGYIGIYLGNFTANASGGEILEELYLGCFQYRVVIDNHRDLVMLNKIQCFPVWDLLAQQAAGAQTVDTWVKTNGAAFVFLSADEVHIVDTLVNFTSVGMLASDSGLSLGGSPTNSYGSASNFWVDTCTYGVEVVSSNSPGWSFSNLAVGGCTARPVYLPAGGGTAPTVYVTGGTFWAGASSVALVSAGTYKQRQVIGSADV